MMCQTTARQYAMVGMAAFSKATAASRAKELAWSESESVEAVKAATRAAEAVADEAGRERAAAGKDADLIRITAELDEYRAVARRACERADRAESVSSEKLSVAIEGTRLEVEGARQEERAASQGQIQRLIDEKQSAIAELGRERERLEARVGKVEVERDRLAADSHSTVSAAHRDMSRATSDGQAQLQECRADGKKEKAAAVEVEKARGDERLRLCQRQLQASTILRFGCRVLGHVKSSTLLVHLHAAAVAGKIAAIEVIVVIVTVVPVVVSVVLSPPQPVRRGCPTPAYYAHSSSSR